MRRRSSQPEIWMMPALGYCSGTKMYNRSGGNKGIVWQVRVMHLPSDGLKIKQPMHSYRYLWWTGGWEGKWRDTRA